MARSHCPGDLGCRVCNLPTGPFGRRNGRRLKKGHRGGATELPSSHAVRVVGPNWTGEADVGELLPALLVPTLGQQRLRTAVAHETDYLGGCELGRAAVEGDVEDVLVDARDIDGRAHDHIGDDLGDVSDRRKSCLRDSDSQQTSQLSKPAPNLAAPIFWLTAFKTCPSSLNSPCVVYPT